MYKVNHVMKLEGPQFFDVSVWNMFCRKKKLTILLLIIFTLGLGSIAISIPALRQGNRNSFILNGGIGIIVTVMASYLVYSNVAHMKKSSANKDFLAKTEKHIKMDEDQIINYRASVGEQIVYKWSQTDGMYDRKNEIVFSMKDRQILVLDKSRLSEDEIQFLKAKGEVLQLWKKDFPVRIWIIIAAVIFILAVLFSIYNIVRPL